MEIQKQKPFFANFLEVQHKSADPKHAMADTDPQKDDVTNPYGDCILTIGYPGEPNPSDS